MTGLFQVALFASAALLFVLEPLLGRLLLPRFGGSPATWTTCLAFFQVALLLGYGYAHVSTRLLAARAQAVLHLGLLLAAFAVLPPGVPPGLGPAGEGSPALALLGALARSALLPFVLLAATGPLVQRWFAATDRTAGRDPYFLSAASNLGSVAGLLAYPLALERALPLAAQGRAWTAGLAVLVVLVAACALRVGPAAAAPPEEREPGPGLARGARWVVLAALPACLLASVSTHLTTDLAPMPLFWVVPLALYLLSYVNAFARRRLVSTRRALAALAALAPALVVLLLARVSEPLPFVLALHLATFSAASLALHGALADDRPGPGGLTAFYFLGALGGALGGLFSALLAPLLFATLLEYPIALVLAVLAAPLGTLAPPGPPWRRARLLDVAVPLALGGWVLAGEHLLAGLEPPSRAALAFGVPAALAYAGCWRPVRLALALAAMLAAGSWDPAAGVALVEARSFFGVHRVGDVSQGGRVLRRLTHGSTIHGLQAVDPATGRPALPREPLAYYHRTGPVARILSATAARAGAGRRVGVVGLGAGSLAAYAETGDRFVFFELDPVVVALAEDERRFTFLAEARRRGAGASVVLGDARLTLATVAPGSLDLLVVDAFSSDSIPLHLLTREALDLYLSRTAPGGAVAFHVSSRWLRLQPIVGDLAGTSGLECFGCFDASRAAGRSPSRWVVLARTDGDLPGVAGDPAWERVAPRPGVAPWTDDHVDVPGAVAWR